MTERNRDMLRGFLIAVLSLGAVLGVLAGSARLIHGPRYHDRFHDRIAETCTEAAFRVYDDRGSDHHKDHGRPPRGPRGEPPPAGPEAPHPPPAQ